MPQPTVFVSYSHRDEEEKEKLVAHLGVLPNVDLWRDDRIGAGGDWKQEITQAMDRASVAILLITVNFLNSGFIQGKEVPRLLERRASEGLTVFPVIAKACTWKKVPWLSKMNVKPKNGTPVWRSGGIHVDEDLAAIAEEVADIIEVEEEKRQEAIEEHLNAARTALEEGAFSKANHLLDAILDEKGLDPGNPEAQRLQSEVDRQEKLSTLHRKLARLKTPAKIVELSEQILKLEPGDQDAQAAKAEAERQLDIAKYRKEATEAFRRAEYEGAIAAWEKLLDLQPKDEAAKVGLEEAEKQQDIRDESARARSLAKDGNHQAALDAWKRVLEVEPDHVEAQEGAEEAQRQLDMQAHRQGAKAAFAKRQYDEAIALWNKLVELEPDNEEAAESIVRTQNLLELQEHLRELEKAAAAGKDEEAVKEWKRISPLLAEDVLKKLNAAIQRRKGQISNLESEKQGLLRELEAKDRAIGEFKEAEENAARQAQADQINALEAQLKKAQDELKNLRSPKRTKKLPSGLVRRDGKIFSEVGSAEMVLIPAGKFQMGSNNGRDNEKPVHPVSLDAFYMDVYPVTVGQYRQFIKATGHRSPNWKKVTEYAPNDDHPIIYVSWHDAMTYCKWAGKILPTEAQWEYAARGGLEGKKYPWGDPIPDGTQCNFADRNTDFPWSDKNVDDGYQYTAPVGKYPPNGYGLYDMAGNVWEWCMDEWDENFYETSPKANPVAGGIITFDNDNFTTVKNPRVLRGGSWSDGDSFLRVAARFGLVPPDTSKLLGFRCARTVTP